MDNIFVTRASLYQQHLWNPNTDELTDSRQRRVLSLWGWTETLAPLSDDKTNRAAASARLVRMTSITTTDSGWAEGRSQ